MARMKIKGRIEQPKKDGFEFHAVGQVIRPRSWAIYGRSGSGKTTFAATFPKPVLILDIRDNGTDSVADVKDVFVRSVEKWEELEDAYYWLREHPTRFKTVVFDTVSQMQQLCMENVLVEKRKSTDRAGDWGTMTRREWGDVSGTMKTWITDFRDLPLEVVFLAQERVSITDDETENPDNMITPEVGPAVIKSVATTLNAAVSIIANTFVRQHRYSKLVKGKRIEKVEPQYALRVGPNPVYLTKIRKPKHIIPPVFIEDPEYKDVMEIIKGV